VAEIVFIPLESFSGEGRVAASPESVKKLTSLGLTAVANTPDQMRVSIQKEIESIRPLVDAGLVQPT